jgi:O-acetylhomoserine/O-acetylserine sulfhydrylase-like pyridoxal-dependent enzyme
MGENHYEKIRSNDGALIAFQRSGAGAPLVLVHGTLGSPNRWPILPALEERFTVYAVDRRGYRESGDAASYAVEREFEDIAAVVNSIEDGVNLLGHSFGGCLNPQEAFLLDRSLKTLEMRVKQQNANALALAQFFADEPRVQRVFYPGLPDSPGHDIARTQMRGFGGMLCIELESLDAAKAFCDALEVGLNATSLGSVETLASIPVLTSHAFMSDDELRAAGVTPPMVRLSAGVEAIDDLIADFKQALARIKHAAQIHH